MRDFFMEEQNQESNRLWSWVKEHVITHVLVAVLLSLILIIVQQYFGTTPFWQWVEANRIVSLTAVVTICFLTIQARPILRRVSAKFEKYLGAGQIVKSCGLVSFWPKGAGWKACLIELEAARPEKIRILAFTGASTFSTEGSPLYELLKRHRGDIEILLAEPDTEFFNERIEQVAAKTNSLAYDLRETCLRDFERSIRYCEDLRKSAPEVWRIEVRTYRFLPIWKMIIFHDYLWLQYYRPGHPDEEMPSYGLRKGGESSLFYPLERVFINHWDVASDNVRVRE
jgi:hypothetical protein